MSKMERDKVVWRMLKNFLANYYDAENFFDAQQNNTKFPTHNNFVVITKKNPKQRALPLRHFDILTQQKKLTGFGNWEYQVDLYGENADSAMDDLHVYLISPDASNYLLPFEQGIGVVKDPMNLTPVGDRYKYIKRYVIIFNVLNISRLALSCPGIALEDIEINIKEIL